MSDMINEWEQYKVNKLEKYKFSIGKYYEKDKCTVLNCEACGEEIDFPRELSEAKYVAGHGPEATNEGKREWANLNNAFNTYCKRHKEKCEPTPPSPCKFELSAPIKQWTDAGMMEYLSKHTDDKPLPELFSIGEIHEPSNANPKAKCVFRHPDSGVLSDALWMDTTHLSVFPLYNQMLSARLQSFKEEKEEQFAHEFVHDILDRCIYTIEMETEHIKEPPRKRVLSIMGLTREIKQDALYVYDKMMDKFMKHPGGEPVTISPDTMKVFLDATFYHEPEVKNKMWGWNGVGFVRLGSSCVKALLLYKPHALQAWLLLCKETKGEIRLVVDEDSSRTIENDVYGFTKRALPLRFKTSGNEGVVCAVLCHGDVDPTEVYDRSLVLPLVKVGADMEPPPKKAKKCIPFPRK